MANIATSEPRGIVLNVRHSDIDRVRDVITLLQNQVAAFSALGPVKTIRALGYGSQDFLLEFEITPSIQDIWSAIHHLQSHRLVLDAEPAVKIDTKRRCENVRRSGGGDDHLPESDPYEWSIRQTRSDAARQAFGVTGRGVRIGHPDTGYTNHPEIMGSRLLIGDGYDFEDDDTDPSDPMRGQSPGHGTSTASVIMSCTDNSPRVHGVAPEVELVPIRVSDSVVHLDFANVVQALYLARDQECHVVSMSLGGPWAGRSLARAVDDLISRGIVLLAAAGNHWKAVVYPAKLKNVVAVAACNAVLAEWSGSARGSSVDIAAPGESVWRAKMTKEPNGQLTTGVHRSSGTSYAVATTAGACALWLQRHGISSLRDRYGAGVASVFMQLLASTCQKRPGWDVDNFGPGILDTEKLVGAQLPVISTDFRIKASVRTGSDSHSFSERIQDHLHNVDAVDIRKIVELVFPVSTARTDSAAKDVDTASLMDEFEFYVATESSVQREIENFVAETKIYRSSDMAAPLPTLKALASPELCSRLA